jgi:hypothetical protein
MECAGDAAAEIRSGCALSNKLIIYVVPYELHDYRP